MKYFTARDHILPQAIDEWLAGNPACSLCQGSRGEDDIIGLYDVPQGHQLAGPRGDVQHIIYTLCEACCQLPDLAERVERTFAAEWN